MFGIDCASTSPAPAKLKASKVGFVCRYLSTPGNPKNLVRAEASRLRSASIDLVCVFETSAKRSLDGHAAGVSDARSAYAQAVGCGAPARTPIYFAVDFDPSPAEQTQIISYLEGAAAAIGKDRVGVYGGYWVVKRALDAGVCRYAWQTYAWSGGNWDPRAQLRQYLNGQTLGGVSVDFNHSMTTDFGQWPRPLPPRPKRKPLVYRTIQRLVGRYWQTTVEPS